MIFYSMEMLCLHVTAVRYMVFPCELHQEVKEDLLVMDASVRMKLAKKVLILFLLLLIYSQSAVGFKQTSISIAGVNTSHAITVESNSFNLAFTYRLGVELSTTALDANRRM